MRLSYRDAASGGRRTVEATVTTAHALSSYGRPVVVLDDGGMVDHLSWSLSGFAIEEATDAERALVQRAVRP